MNDKMINLHGIKFPRSFMDVHMTVLGSTGSGKTNGIIKPLLRQLLAQGDAAVIFDPKGDLLDITRDALARCGRQDDLVTLGVDPSDHTFNPIGDPTLAAHDIASQLVSTAGLTGQSTQQQSRNDEIFWQQARMELLCALCELVKKLAGQAPLDFSHFQQLRPFLSLEDHKLRQWVQEVSKKLSENGAAGLTEFANYPDSTRACCLGSATSVFSPYLRKPLSDFVIPSKTRPALDLTDIINRSKVMVVTAGRAENAQSLWPAFLLFKLALYRLILARTRLPVRQDNHLVVILDEYTRMILGSDSPMSEHVVLEAARSNKVSFVLAAQNLAGLEIAGGGSVVVDKLTALTGNLCFLTNSCSVTARLAANVLGRRKTFEKHRSITHLPPPPLFFPQQSNQRIAYTNTTLVPIEKPVLSHSKLARLKAGQGYIKIADGSVHKIKCTFD